MNYTGNLRMPEGFVYMDSDDMMYLEGGANDRTLEGVITANQCAKIAAEMRNVATAYEAAAICFGATSPITSLLITCAAAGLRIAGIAFQKGAAGSGIAIYSRISTGGTANPIPETKAYSFEYL